MTPAEAARILGIDRTAPWEEVRVAYRALIAIHHPDRSGDTTQAIAINEAYRVLRNARGRAAATPRTSSAESGPSNLRPPWAGPDEPGAPPVHRLSDDTLGVAAPADECFRWLLEAAHDLGEVTYVDRSMPIAEVLCRFEGEPATSLVLTLQGRAEGTEVFCTVESIEARPGPPAAAVVDLLELALHRRRGPGADPGDQSP